MEQPDLLLRRVRDMLASLGDAPDRRRVIRRLRAVELRLTGWPVTAVARRQGISASTVRRIVRRVRERGPMAADDRRRSGRPKRRDDVEALRIGFALLPGRARQWTVRSLAEALGEGRDSVHRTLRKGGVLLDAASTGEWLTGIRGFGKNGVQIEGLYMDALRYVFVLSERQTAPAPMARIDDRQGRQGLRDALKKPSAATGALVDFPLLPSPGDLIQPIVDGPSPETLEKRYADFLKALPTLRRRRVALIGAGRVRPVLPGMLCRVVPELPPLASNWRELLQAWLRDAEAEGCPEVETVLDLVGSFRTTGVLWALEQHPGIAWIRRRDRKNPRASIEEGGSWPPSRQPGIAVTLPPRARRRAPRSPTAEAYTVDVATRTVTRGIDVAWLDSDAPTRIVTLSPSRPPKVEDGSIKMCSIDIREPGRRGFVQTSALLIANRPSVSAGAYRFLRFLLRVSAPPDASPETYFGTPERLGERLEPRRLPDGRYESRHESLWGFYGQDAIQVGHTIVACHRPGAGKPPRCYDIAHYREEVVRPWVRKASADHVREVILAAKLEWRPDVAAFLEECLCRRRRTGDREG